MLVRHVGGHGRDACVVTFDSFTDDRTLDRPGFGQVFLDESGIDAIHVIARDNDWYQYADMADAMLAVKEAAGRYGRVTTYGSSMGGYAAIRLAGLAGAHAVLALSPQYSIDPAIAPWERRWIACSRAFRPVWERVLPLPAVSEAYVVYDPLDLDRRQIRLLGENGFAFQPIGIPHAGHPITGYLAEVGLLQSGILEVARGCFEAAAFTTVARARQRDSAQFYMTRSGQTSKRRQGRRVALMREAFGRAPGNVAVVSRLALELSWAGAFDAAFALHARALELVPGHPRLLFEYSQSQELRGDYPEALATMERLVADTGVPPIYRERLDTLRAWVAQGGPGWRERVTRPVRWLRGWRVTRLAGER